jgi:hypothetical protein
MDSMTSWLATVGAAVSPSKKLSVDSISVQGLSIGPRNAKKAYWFIPHPTAWTPEAVAKLFKMLPPAQFREAYPEYPLPQPDRNKSVTDWLVFVLNDYSTRLGL